MEEKWKSQKIDTIDSEEKRNNIGKQTRPNINGSKYDSFGAMTISESSLFKSDFLEGIKATIVSGNLKNTEVSIGNNNFIVDNEGVFHGEGFAIVYDEKYSYIRIYLDRNHGIPININLNNGEIYIMDAKNLEENSIKLLTLLEKTGILQEHIPYVSDKKIKRLITENKFVNDYINEHNSTQLPFNSTDTLDPDKTINVLQQGSVIINDPIEGQALYSPGAGPCLILSVYDKDTGKIGLAHIDESIKKREIINFLSYFSDNPDITIISGIRSTSSNVLKAIKSINLEKNISFMNSDLDGAREDSVAIRIRDGKPEILYGYNPNITLTEKEIKKLRLIGIEQQGNLKIDIK